LLEMCLPTFIRRNHKPLSHRRGGGRMRRTAADWPPGNPSKAPEWFYPADYSLKLGRRQPENLTACQNIF